MRAFLMGALVFILSLAAFANWDLEERKINFLINSVDQLDASFVRNGKEYDGHTAAEHLREKLNSALSNPFSGKNDQYTVQDFIEKIASKSFLTGSPYYIKFHDGHTIAAHDWLYQQLSLFQN